MPRKSPPRDDGQFDTLYDDQEFIDAVSNSNNKIDTASVADEVGASRRHAYDRLTELEEKEVVKSNKVGNSTEWGLVDHDENELLAEAINFISSNLSKNVPVGLDSYNGMVITIREPHSKAILDGKKNVEFRRTTLKESNIPEVGFIYEPSPTKAIVGVFSISKVESLPIAELKKLAKGQSTSSPKSIEMYFDGKEEGTAIFIETAEPIEPEISLHAGSGDNWAFTPPQNFYYVDPGEFMVSLQNQNRESPLGESQQVGSSFSTS